MLVAVRLERPRPPRSGTALGTVYNKIIASDHQFFLFQIPAPLVTILTLIIKGNTAADTHYHCPDSQASDAFHPSKKNNAHEHGEQQAADNQNCAHYSPLSFSNERIAAVFRQHDTIFSFLLVHPRTKCSKICVFVNPNNRNA